MGESESRSFQPSVSLSLKPGLQTSRVVASNDHPMPASKRYVRFGFLRRLLILVGQKNTWSPIQILGELWRLLINLGMRREILSVLKLRPFDEVVQNNPELAFKYVVPNYLARGFTVTERASCFLHHYRRMHSAFPECVLRQILQCEVTLYEIAKDGHRFAVTMSLPEPAGHLEGELSLDLQVNGKKAFNLSFIIAPGWVVKLEVAEILLILRLQGTKGCNSQIRLVRKVLNEYSPRKLLLAALQGIADALGIGELGAVCATNQRCYGVKSAAILENGYDNFFATIGMVKVAAGFYSRPVPVEEKPLASFKGRSRARARKRRAIRQQIRAGSAYFLANITGRSTDSALSTVSESLT